MRPYFLHGTLLSFLRLLAVFAYFGVAHAQEVLPGPLDGMRFSTSIVREDGSAAPIDPLNDTLVFSNGRFSSAICERYNFGPAEYWVRQSEGTVAFMAELNSDTDGRMIWHGTVADGQLVGTMRWIRPRWYRTIDVTHRISGTVSTE